MTTAGYVHIPFCRKHCYYCDFPIFVIGPRSSSKHSPSIEQYLNFLCQEILITPPVNHSLQTIFFGGGTPSLLSVSQLGRILETLAKHFGIAQDAEISIEMDPGTFTLEQVRGYRELGINRISLGIQAFQDELLQQCGRCHRLEDIFTAVDWVRQGGITNLSFDLIGGLPKQTLSQWEFSLYSALALAPEHLSCYDLVLEPLTVFGKKYQAGQEPLPLETTTAAMYQTAQAILTKAGFVHYEISNYARPGYQSRHNRVYWENRPYYGWGMGAASYVEGKRLTRPRSREKYYDWINEGAQGGELVGEVDRTLETLMLGLRLADGVDLAQFDGSTLGAIDKAIAPYYPQNLVMILGEQGEILTPPLPAKGRLRLTDPQGFLLSNTILTALFKHLDHSC